MSDVRFLFLMKLGISKYAKRGIKILSKQQAGTFDDICEDCGVQKHSIYYFIKELLDNNVFILSRKEKRQGSDTSLYYIDIKNLKEYIVNNSEQFESAYNFIKKNMLDGVIAELEDLNKYKKDKDI